MFFHNASMSRNNAEDGDKDEKLLIIGRDVKKRRGAELQVMSSVELQIHGYYTANLKERMSQKQDFTTDRFLLREEDISYVLGKHGATRRKLQNASGAVMQYVGRVCFISGTFKERRR